MNFIFGNIRVSKEHKEHVLLHDRQIQLCACVQKQSRAFFSPHSQPSSYMKSETNTAHETFR